MNIKQLSQIFGYIGLALTILAGALYAVDTSNRATADMILGGGLLAFALFAVFNVDVIRGFFTRRSARHGANMIVMILLFGCIAVIVQTLSMRHRGHYDLTRNQRFTLSEQTVNLLSNLEKDVEIFGFYTSGSVGREIATEVLNPFAIQSERIRYEFIDPDRDPQRAENMNVTRSGTVVLKYGKKTETINRVAEETLANAILKLTREGRKKVYFVHGHGEKDPDGQRQSGYGLVKTAIEAANYEARKLSLFEEPSVPDDCAVLVIAGPKRDYLESEIDKINRHLALPKNALFLIDPVDPMPNIEQLLTTYRVLLERDVIIDRDSRVYGHSPTVPVVTQYVDHPITKALDLATVFPRARSINLSADMQSGVTGQYLAIASKAAWGETDLELVKEGQASQDDDDIAAPIAVAMIASRMHEGSESHIVAVGDSDFATNSSFGLLGNTDFFLNIINFLAEEKDLLAIRPKDDLGDQLFLTASQGRLIFFLCIILLPLLVMALGTTVLIRKRKHA